MLKNRWLSTKFIFVSENVWKPAGDQGEWWETDKIFKSKYLTFSKQHVVCIYDVSNMKEHENQIKNMMKKKRRSQELV